MNQPQPPLFLDATLSEVQSRFAAWRKNKNHRDRIPEDLWTSAVMLCQEHSLHKISKTLSLSYPDLKKQVASRKALAAPDATALQDFIPIDCHMHSDECVIEMEHHNGNKMRMHFKGKADLDLQSFAESFWSTKV